MRYKSVNKQLQDVNSDHYPLKKKGWLFIIPWMIEDIGGVNRVVLELCMECSKTSNFLPFILTPDWACTRIKEQKKNDYTQVSVRMRALAGKKIKIKNILSYFFYLPFEIQTQINLIKKYNIRVVNFHYVGGISALSHVLIKRFIKKELRILLSFHGSDILTIEQLPPFKRLIFNFILSSADYLISPSTGLSNQINNLFPQFSHKTRTINNGISDLFFYCDRKKDCNYDLPDELRNKPFLLSVGAFIEVKGHDLLIEAFSKIRKKNPEIILAVIGKPATESDRILTLIHSLHLNGYVHIYETVSPDRMKVLYDHAKILISSSRYESFGLVLAEAGARGLPVVATKTVGACEIIDNKQNGLLVDLEDSRGIADAVLYLIEHPAIAAMYSRNLKDKVSSHFRWNRAWEKYSCLMEDTYTKKEYHK